MAVQDLIAGGIIALFLVVTIPVGLFMFNSVMDSLLGSGGYDAELEASLRADTDKWNPTFDGGVIFWFALLWVFSVVMAFYLDNSPVFFILFVILLLLVIGSLIALGVFASAFKEGSGLFTELPMISFLIDFWPVFLTFYGITLGAALYAKRAFA
jgi:hypothetical protein